VLVVHVFSRIKRYSIRVIRSVYKQG